MGCCFSTEDGGDESKPLLGNTSKRSTPVLQVPSETGPYSARRYRPTDSPGLTQPDPLPLSLKPVKVRHVDKRLQDHAQLYNEHLERRNNLLDTMKELRNMFAEDNPNQNLHDCFYSIRKQCKIAEVPQEAIQVKRRFKFCMEIQYEGKDLPHKVIPALVAFNKANRLVKDILDKGLPLTKSVELVVEQEKDLRRDVLVASLGSDGPDCMKNCLENVSQLKAVSGLVDDFKTQAIKAFEELKSASQILLFEDMKA